AATPPSVQRGYRALQAEIRGLRRRLAALEDYLRADSHNSSRPPSSDPPARPRPPPAPRTRRRRGAQPGRAPTPRAPVPTPDVVVPCLPAVCGHCGEGLAGVD